MKRIFFLLILPITAVHLSAAVWQWSTPVTEWISDETNAHPHAFLWIPEDCKQVRAVVIGMHNMCEETIFIHPEFRNAMSKLDFAVVWISPLIDYQWKVENGCQSAFDQMLNDLAEASGYSELKTAPIVPVGHSAMATFPWNFAAWNKQHTLAIISFKGDAPRTNLTGYGRENMEWGRTRNIDSIPGLMIEGEYEWWEARVNPALAFRMMYPESCISFLADAGHGHFDVSDSVVDYICLFLRKVAEYRLSDTTHPANFKINHTNTYCMGLNNPRRTGDIWLMAHTPGDKKHKSAVQQINFKIPYPNTEGDMQTITFPAIKNIAGLKNNLPLQATSDSGLPVYYYVKEGVAEIIDNQITFAKIPPRAKTPHKITVVAWQYGIAGKIRTAEVVEQSFYIEE